MTHRSTWQKAETEVGKFHNPLDGRRTPLSGSNSGVTHGDCIGCDGIFIEVKYRSKFALWKLYEETAYLAKMEGKIPVVAIKQKGKRGFIDLVHANYIDQYVQHMARNREIKITESKVHVFDQEMPLLFTGTPAQVKFLIDRLTHRAFHGDGTLREEWWNIEGERLASWVQSSHNFQISLYGHFNFKLKVAVQIDQESVNTGLGQYKR